MAYKQAATGPSEAEIPQAPTLAQTRTALTATDLASGISSMRYALSNKGAIDPSSIRGSTLERNPAGKGFLEGNEAMMELKGENAIGFAAWLKTPANADKLERAGIHAEQSGKPGSPEITLVNDNYLPSSIRTNKPLRNGMIETLNAAETWEAAKAETAFFTVASCMKAERALEDAKTRLPQKSYEVLESAALMGRMPFEMIREGGPMPGAEKYADSGAAFRAVARYVETADALNASAVPESTKAFLDDKMKGIRDHLRLGQWDNASLEMALAQTHIAIYSPEAGIAEGKKAVLEAGMAAAWNAEQKGDFAKAARINGMAQEYFSDAKGAQLIQKARDEAAKRPLSIEGSAYPMFMENGKFSEKRFEEQTGVPYPEFKKGGVGTVLDRLLADALKSVNDAQKSIEEAIALEARSASTKGGPMAEVQNKLAQSAEHMKKADELTGTALLGLGYINHMANLHKSAAVTRNIRFDAISGTAAKSALKAKAEGVASSEDNAGFTFMQEFFERTAAARAEGKAAHDSHLNAAKTHQKNGASAEAGLGKKTKEMNDAYKECQTFEAYTNGMNAGVKKDNASLISGIDSASKGLDEVIAKANGIIKDVDEPEKRKKLIADKYSPDGIKARALAVIAQAELSKDVLKQFKTTLEGQNKQSDAAFGAVIGSYTPDNVVKDASATNDGSRRYGYGTSAVFSQPRALEAAITNDMHNGNDAFNGALGGLNKNLRDLNFMESLQATPVDRPDMVIPSMLAGIAIGRAVIALPQMLSASSAPVTAASTTSQLLWTSAGQAFMVASVTVGAIETVGGTMNLISARTPQERAMAETQLREGAMNLVIGGAGKAFQLGNFVREGFVLSEAVGFSTGVALTANDVRGWVSGRKQFSGMDAVSDAFLMLPGLGLASEYYAAASRVPKAVPLPEKTAFTVAEEMAPRITTPGAPAFAQRGGFIGLEVRGAAKADAGTASALKAGRVATEAPEVAAATKAIELSRAQNVVGAANDNAMAARGAAAAQEGAVVRRLPTAAKPVAAPGLSFDADIASGAGLKSLKAAELDSLAGALRTAGANDAAIALNNYRQTKSTKDLLKAVNAINTAKKENRITIITKEIQDEMKAVAGGGRSMASAQRTWTVSVPVAGEATPVAAEFGAGAAASTGAKVGTAAPAIVRPIGSASVSVVPSWAPVQPAELRGFLKMAVADQNARIAKFAEGTLEKSFFTRIQGLQRMEKEYGLEGKLVSSYLGADSEGNAARNVIEQMSKSTRPLFNKATTERAEAEFVRRGITLKTPLEAIKPGETKVFEATNGKFYEIRNEGGMLGVHEQRTMITPEPLPTMEGGIPFVRSVPGAVKGDHALDLVDVLASGDINNSIDRALPKAIGARRTIVGISDSSANAMKGAFQITVEETIGVGENAVKIQRHFLLKTHDLSPNKFADAIISDNGICTVDTATGFGKTPFSYMRSDGKPGTFGMMEHMGESQRTFTVAGREINIVRNLGANDFEASNLRSLVEGPETLPFFEKTGLVRVDRTGAAPKVVYKKEFFKTMGGEAGFTVFTDISIGARDGKAANAWMKVIEVSADDAKHLADNNYLVTNVSGRWQALVPARIDTDWSVDFVTEFVANKAPRSALHIQSGNGYHDFTPIADQYGQKDVWSIARQLESLGGAVESEVPASELRKLVLGSMKEGGELWYIRNGRRPDFAKNFVSRIESAPASQPFGAGSDNLVQGTYVRTGPSNGNAIGRYMDLPGGRSTIGMHREGILGSFKSLNDGMRSSAFRDELWDQIALRARNRLGSGR